MQGSAQDSAQEFRGYNAKSQSYLYRSVCGSLSSYSVSCSLANPLTRSLLEAKPDSSPVPHNSYIDFAHIHSVTMPSTDSGRNSPILSAFGLPLRSNSTRSSRRASPDRSVPRDQLPKSYNAAGTNSNRSSYHQYVVNETPTPATPTLSALSIPSSPTAPAVHSEATRKILATMNEGGRRSAPSSPRSSMDNSTTSFDSVRSSGSDWPTHPYELNTIAELDTLPIGTEVNFRGRIHTQRQLSKALDFLLLRDQTYSIQGVLSRENMDMVQWVQKLPAESLLQINGVLKTPPEPVRSATVSHAEVDIHGLWLVNPAQNAPFSVYRPPEALRNRMSSRILDLRHPANQALFRIRSQVSHQFRETLEGFGFVEINTPKLQPAATESGASVFKVNYFGRKAFLTQPAARQANVHRL